LWHPRDLPYKPRLPRLRIKKTPLMVKLLFDRDRSRLAGLRDGAMRAVIQRVSSASVAVGGAVTGNIDHGLVVLLGIESADAAEDVAWLAAKIVSLRLFEDEDGQMSRSVIESSGGILLVSQFTLFASTKKGTKPSWHRAAKPDHAQPLYEHAVAKFAEVLGRPVATGQFGAMMQVALVNDGPVTLLLDTKARE